MVKEAHVQKVYRQILYIPIVGDIVLLPTRYCDVFSEASQCRLGRKMFTKISRKRNLYPSGVTD